MRKSNFFLACSAGLVLVFAFALSAETTRVVEPKIPFEPRTYVCYRAAGPVTVDGNLDEDVWDKASWSDPFVDIEGGKRPKPRFRTMVKMLWDDLYFYVGAYLEEPNVWGTLTRHDSVIYEDNDFEVFIDPDGDTHHYFETEINALRTVWDLFLINPYRDGRPANIQAWDIPGMQTGVLINGTLNNPKDKDKSWFVELAFPWDVLQEAAHPAAPPQPGDQWRVDFSRVEYRTAAADGNVVKAADPATGKPYPEETWVWSPTGVVDIHYPEMWGYVQFSGKTAGKGRDSFVSRPEEKAKWVLRRLYYREWAHFAEKGSFTSDVNALGLKEKELKVTGFVYPPVLQTTDRMFEASYAGTGGAVWRIRQDGRVWKDQ
ncbi:MAG: carbohydrate-binding family 9-like protein [Candidatus Aminicenantes bacterium]|nr:carbohydrate-binding family 9-like protein [Candidatus Aminicenantes bacterium]